MFKIKAPIADLTSEEFALAYSAFKDLVAKEHATLLDMEAKDEFGSKTFNTISGVNFFNREQIESENIDNEDADDVINILTEWLAVCKEYENKPGYYTQQKYSISGDDGWADLDCVYYEIEYQTVKAEIAETTVNTAFKDFVNAWLAPDEEAYVQGIDCKLLQLYKQGAIDWKTLRTLTYTECEV